MSVLIKQLAEELNIDETHARNAVHLLFEEKGTIPFITRYRKEKTGSMSEVVLCKLRDRYVYLQELEATKVRYLKVIEEHAKEKADVQARLPQLRESIAKCTSKQELEDLYLPFKPKRRTRAMSAREKGLDGLLHQIFEQWFQLQNLKELATPFVKTEGVEANLQVADEEEALKGAADIFAESINETASYRNLVRRISHETGVLVARKNERMPNTPEMVKAASKYENYFDYKEGLQKAPSHRVMAVRRGEAEKILSVSIDVDEERILSELYTAVREEKGPGQLSEELEAWLQKTLSDAYKRLIAPAIETELRMEIKLRSETEAIEVFASNLRNLLLLPPTPKHVVCGVDPGLRTGAKIAIVSETGQLLDHCILYPKLMKANRKKEAPASSLSDTITTSEEGASVPAEALQSSESESEEEVVSVTHGDDVGNRKEASIPIPISSELPEGEIRSKAEEILRKLFEQYKVTCVALGNGTGSREIDTLILKVIKSEGFQHIKRYIVNESGASVYSTDEIAREEFPDLDPTIRSAVSIARRLQDPLAELVKIDPRSLGVGQYQHDCDVSKLDRSLKETVESCVNTVGVNLNTASFKLLSYVSGIGPTLAKNMVSYREKEGAFKSRKELLEVSGFGPKTFEQAAGFLRVPSTENPLDNSAVHPERYEIVEKIAEDLKVPVQELVGKDELLRSIALEKYVGEDIGMPTLMDITKELAKPGRDPREDQERLQYSTDITSIQDLKVGMKLRGTVSNVTRFGCFVDLGVHQDGLVHISELPPSEGDPASVVSVGQILEVYVKGIDIERNRISLSTRKPASQGKREATVRAPSNGPVLSPVSTKPKVQPSGGFALKPIDPSAPRLPQQIKVSRPIPPNNAQTPRGQGAHANRHQAQAGIQQRRPLQPNMNRQQQQRSRDRDKSFSMDDLLSKFNNRV